ncbi:hypothetical protein OBK28_12065 [Empedobacter falsenii]
MSKNQNHQNNNYLPGITPSSTNYNALSVVNKVNVNNSKYTKFGIHAVTQFYDEAKQLSLFSEEKIEQFTKATGIDLNDKPDSYGVVLNIAQKKVYEGITKAFYSANDYEGDEKTSKSDHLKEIYTPTSDSVKLLSKDDNAPYKHLDEIPVIRLTQSKLLELAGFSRSQGDKTDLIEAIKFLSTKQFCFYWMRLKKDLKGIPIKDNQGNYIKEEVMEVGTMFHIKYIMNNGVLEYYEIKPSSVMIDQVKSKYGGEYFLLVPDNWRDEVKQITGKRASGYTYEFLFWLRLQFEHMRRYNNNKHRKQKQYIIKKSWEEIAIILKMPESMYKRQRKRTASIIRNAYDIAIQLQYLTKIEEGDQDILYLNENYFPKPGELM